MSDNDKIFSIIVENLSYFYFDEHELRRLQRSGICLYNCVNIITVLEVFGNRNIQIINLLFESIVKINISNNLLKYFASINDIIFLKMILRVLSIREDTKDIKKLCELLLTACIGTNKECDIYSLIIFDEKLRNIMI